MKISVIIPAFNAGKTIGRCLESVISQKNDGSFDVETIIVNDASRDETAKIVRQFDVKQIILENNSGPAAARNRGIGEAAGDIILFIDSDVEFKNSDALIKIVECFKSRQEIDGIIMIKDKKPLNRGLTARYWALYKYYLWNLPGEYQTSFTTERAAVRRRVFDKVGVFNDKYKKADVEDFEFGYRLDNAGFKVLILRDIKVLHHFETFKQSIIKTIKRSGQWIRLFVKRKKFDPVYSSRDRGVKILIAAIIPASLIVAFFAPYGWIAFIFIFFVYLFYSAGFFKFLVKERETLYIIPFIFFDILFSFLAVSGAAVSLAHYYLTERNE